MQIPHFEEAVNEIAKSDSRYNTAAYVHLKDGLDFTINRIKENEKGTTRHVDALELLEGIRDYSIEEYGPMAATLLTEWGINTCDDIGEMVYQLIDCGMFGKQESDTREAFANPFNLISSLEEPFIPKKPKKTT